MFNVVTTIAGDTGNGKTTSMRNLRNNAILYNVEQKELPFPRKDNQVRDFRVSHPNMMFYDLPKIMIRPDIDIVVLDSFSHTVNYFKFKSQYEDENKNYDIFRGYNNMIFAMFELFKKLMNKYVFVLAHAETISTPEGQKDFIAVDGNVYAKKVEQFAVVSLAAKKYRITDPNGRSKNQYLFEYDSPNAATKAPMGMFEGDLSNDISEVVKTYAKFWNHPSMLERILMYESADYTSELIRRMEEMKSFYKGPLNLDAHQVDNAFQEAYNLIPWIMNTLLPKAKAKAGNPTVVAVAQPQQTVQQAAPQPAPQQAQPTAPAPQAVAPQPVAAAPSPQPAAPSNVQTGPAPGVSAQVSAPTGIPQPGQSISAVDELIGNI